MSILIAGGVAVVSLLFLIGSLIRSIQNEKRANQSVWKGFGLSLSLLILFLTSWVAQGISQWEVYKHEQEEHNQPVEVVGYVHEFFQATFENWQSEFLQLFSFVVLAALFIHKGSAESKDGDEEIKQALKRIEKKLEGVKA